MVNYTAGYALVYRRITVHLHYLLQYSYFGRPPSGLEVCLRRLSLQSCTDRPLFIDSRTVMP